MNKASAVPVGGGEMLRPRKCLDGKVRMKSLRGYDCTHWKWHSVPYIHSECVFERGEYYKDCVHSEHPTECPNFVERKG